MLAGPGLAGIDDGAPIVRTRRVKRQKAIDLRIGIITHQNYSHEIVCHMLNGRCALIRSVPLQDEHGHWHQDRLQAQDHRMHQAHGIDGVQAKGMERSKLS